MPAGTFLKGGARRRYGARLTLETKSARKHVVSSKCMCNAPQGHAGTHFLSQTQMLMFEISPSVVVTRVVCARLRMVVITFEVAQLCIHMFIHLAAPHVLSAIPGRWR
jgi:hypothetical protein